MWRGPGAGLAAAWMVAMPALSAEKALPCSATDVPCAVAAAKAHRVIRAEAWAGALKLPVDQRLGPAPPALVEYLALANIAQGYREKPRVAILLPDFLADVRAAIEELPQPVKNALGNDFVGLYFVEDLGGTGFCTVVFDGMRPAGGFIVLDAAALAARSGNHWATWKENTPFAGDAAYGIEARIATDANDNRKAAIQYILLHELGHVISINARVHPLMTLRPKDVAPSEEFAYFNLSWRVDRARDRFESVFDNAFDLRGKVVYYRRPALPASDMVRAYEQLEATNFPTLYAATDPGDDFAEAFANYVHVVMMRKPFEIQLVQGGRTIKKYGACWEEQRCAGKRRILEALLGVPAARR